MSSNDSDSVVITHEIYDSVTGHVFGTAVELEDSSLSITIGDSFVGIFDTFNSWNLD